MNMKVKRRFKRRNKNVKEDKEQNEKIKMNR